MNYPDEHDSYGTQEDDSKEFAALPTRTIVYGIVGAGLLWLGMYACVSLLIDK